MTTTAVLLQVRLVLQKIDDSHEERLLVQWIGIASVSILDTQAP